MKFRSKGNYSKYNDKIIISVSLILMALIVGISIYKFYFAGYPVW